MLSAAETITTAERVSSARVGVVFDTSLDRGSTTAVEYEALNTSMYDLNKIVSTPIAERAMVACRAKGHYIAEEAYRYRVERTVPQRLLRWAQNWRSRVH